MDPLRRTALLGGWFYLATFVTSIPALLMKSPVMDHTDFVLGVGSTNSVQWASVLDVLLAIACVGTAVTLYPVTRRHNPTLGLGFVTSRLAEGAIIIVGVMSLLSIVTLRTDAATGDTSSLLAAGQALTALHQWSFLLGPGLMAGINALLLGALMYRSRLVPRLIPAMGLIGAPLLIGSTFATILGAWSQTSSIAGVATLPVALWELSFGLWLVIKGFDARADAAADATTSTPGVATAT
jgi:hypothetical protein